MEKYPSPCDTCQKNEAGCLGVKCQRWITRYRYRQKQINAVAMRMARPNKSKKYFCYSHPDEVREFLQKGPCVDCKAESVCSVPCAYYWQWWDARMAVARKKVGL